MSNKGTSTYAYKFSSKGNSRRSWFVHVTGYHMAAANREHIDIVETEITLDCNNCLIKEYGLEMCYNWRKWMYVGQHSQ